MEPATRAGKPPPMCGDWYISNVSDNVPRVDGDCLNLASTFRPATLALHSHEQSASKGTARPGKLRMAAAQVRN